MKKTAIRSLVIDLREYANELPDKIINNYHGDLDSLIDIASSEVAELERNLKESLNCNNELLKIIKELRGLR